MNTNRDFIVRGGISPHIRPPGEVLLPKWLNQSTSSNCFPWRTRFSFKPIFEDAKLIPNIITVIRTVAENLHLLGGFSHSSATLYAYSKSEQTSVPLFVRGNRSVCIQISVIKLWRWKRACLTNAVLVNSGKDRHKYDLGVGCLLTEIRWVKWIYLMTVWGCAKGLHSHESNTVSETCASVLRPVAKWKSGQYNPDWDRNPSLVLIHAPFASTR